MQAQPDEELTVPRFSIITAVYNPPLRAFDDTVASVLAQQVDDWEWVLVDDCSPNAEVTGRLAAVAAADARIRVVRREVNGGIVAASSDALALATGEFVILLDHDDVLAPRALAAMLEAVLEHPDLDYAYSDQDLMTQDGKVHDPFHKPKWSPERLRHHMYVSHLSLYRRSLVLAVGGFRTGFDGSQDHDLALRVTERAREIVHVGEVLYHWRAVPGSAAADQNAKPYAWDAGVRAVQEHLDRVGIPATASRGPRPGLYHVDREPDLLTPVSVIIPTIGTRAMVWGSPRALVVDTVRSLVAKSRHSNVEYVIVYDPPTPPEVLDELRSIPGAKIKLVGFNAPFNFSAKCNLGALHSSGDVLVFLNDDMEAESEGLVEQLIAPLREPGVGATGPKLLFPTMRIQHAGLAYGSGTVAHSYYGVAHHQDEMGAYGDLWINREATALTGACLAMRREVFEDVGGFCEQLPVNYNDVDLCLKIGRFGLRLIWLHDVVLFHFESMSRSSTVHPWEKNLLERRWGDYRFVREELSNNVR